MQFPIDSPSFKLLFFDFNNSKWKIRLIDSYVKECANTKSQEGQLYRKALQLAHPSFEANLIGGPRTCDAKLVAQLEKRIKTVMLKTTATRISPLDTNQDYSHLVETLVWLSKIGILKCKEGQARQDIVSLLEREFKRPRGVGHTKLKNMVSHFLKSNEPPAFVVNRVLKQLVELKQLPDDDLSAHKLPLRNSQHAILHLSEKPYRRSIIDQTYSDYEKWREWSEFWKKHGASPNPDPKKDF